MDIMELEDNNIKISSWFKDRDYNLWIEKHRPKNIDEVVDENDFKDFILNIIKKKDFPHLFFCGQPGTGKTTISMIISKILYGEDVYDMVMHLNASDERGIEIINNKIKNFLQGSKLSTRFKLVILDEADSMTKDAQNSLNIIMEEFMFESRFIILCNESNKISEHLRSRCFERMFLPISKNCVRKNLLNICKLEQVKYSLEGIEAIINIAKGDMRSSINILQSSFLSFNVIEEDLIYLLTSKMNPKDIVKIFDHLVTIKNPKITIDFIEGLKKSKGFYLKEVIIEIYNFINLLEIDLNVDKKGKIFILLADIEKNLINNGSEKINLGRLVFEFYLIFNT